MQIPFKSGQRNQSGYALTITLTFLMITLIVFASIMYWVSSSARVSKQNNLFNASQAAAQAGVERVVAQMDRDFLYGNVNTATFYASQVGDIVQTGWPIQYTFSDTNGTAGQITVNMYPIDWSTNYEYNLGSQFPGLYGAVQHWTLAAVATPLNQGYDMSSTVIETLRLSAIPVFQFGVFYNLDLDFSPGQPLTMNGKVHCNGTIWMCPQADAYFNDLVEASIVVTNRDNPNDQQNLTFNSSKLHYTPSMPPISHADSLSMPINGQNTNPTNVHAIIDLPPNAIAIPNDPGYLQTNQIFLYNECDLIISNAASGINGKSVYGTNLSVFFSDKFNPLGRLILVPNDLQWITTNIVPGVSTNRVTNCFYSFVTNVTFYDHRESDTVQAIQIDISSFNKWLTNTVTRGSNQVAGYPWNFQLGGANGDTGDKAHPIDSIYVYNSVPLTSSQIPAVRVKNGTRLPSPKGLTIATPMPLYVAGDYNVKTNIGGSSSLQTTNTAWTWPAALMGDSITILSANWLSFENSDSNYLAGGNYSSRNAVNTTVNAACLEGIVQSTFAGGAKHYSGGLENFLRLLEDWNGTTLCYNGSIVVMFPSVYATNFWIGPGTYYDKPTRMWGFDSNFKTPNGSPPCAPSAKRLIRDNWSGNGQ